jgi:hypothetical protein
MDRLSLSLRPLFAWAIGVTGIALIAFATILEPKGRDIGHTAVGIVVEIGVALIVLGGIGVLLELEHWRRYFDERIRKAVLLDLETFPLERTADLAFRATAAQVGLSTASMEAMEAVRLNDLRGKVLFDLQGGYRSNMVITLIYSLSPENNFRVFDKTEYTLQEVAQQVPGKIVFGAKAGEIAEAMNLQFFVRETPASERVPLLDDKEIASALRSRFVETVEKTIPKKYRKAGNKVFVEASYCVNRERILYWNTSSLVYQYRMSIEPPPGFEVTPVPFMSKEPPDPDRAMNRAADALRNETWVLPDQGVAWRLILVEGEPTAS